MNKPKIILALLSILPLVAGIVLADDLKISTSDYAVVPLFSGAVKRLAVSAGDKVRKGDPVAWIGSPEFLALQSEYIDVLHQSELGTTRYLNDKTLNEEGIVSTRRLTESKHELEEFRLAEQRLRQFLLLSGFNNAKIDSMHESLHLQAEMILYAPIDGIVLEAYATAGQQIDSSQAVYRIADLSTLWLEIDVPFVKSIDITPGTTVFVDKGKLNISATVTNIGSHVDENNQTLVVRAVVENNSGLAPGQFVTATFTKSRSGDYLLLPVGSVVRKEDRDYVFVRNVQGVEAREIETIRQTQGRIVIGAGITADDSVVIRGTAALKARWLGMGGGE